MSRRYALRRMTTTSRRQVVRWTRDTFLGGIHQGTDRTAATWLLDQAEAEPIVGPGPPVHYGIRSNDGVYLNPGGGLRAPAYLWLKANGAVTIAGTWTYPFNRVTNRHPAYGYLAAFFRQELSGSASGVPVADLDLMTLWPILCDCARRLDALLAADS